MTTTRKENVNFCLIDSCSQTRWISNNLTSVSYQIGGSAFLNKSIKIVKFFSINVSHSLPEINDTPHICSKPHNCTGIRLIFSN